MSSYDEPDVGHGTAIRQLANSRSRIMNQIRDLSSQTASSDPHPNLVERSNAPTKQTVATAGLADYLLQLRPYRHTADEWERGAGSIRLPEQIEQSGPGRGRNNGGVYVLDRAPVVEVTTLSHVINLAGLNVTYSRDVAKTTRPDPGAPIPDTAPARDVDETDKVAYQFVLTPQQLRELFEAADEVAHEMGFLAELGESRARDSEGF